MIDLRSDTVTRPTKEMRHIMASAEVGDDVYGEDPVVNSLQAEMATLFGKEAGLFVPSGSMGNQLALKAWTQPGDEVICEAEAHIFHYETVGPSIISGVQLHPVTSRRGAMHPDHVRAAIRPPEYYYPRTRLVCMENTHNRHGGSVISLDEMQAVADVAHDAGLAVHLDGARIWNAHAATGIPLHDYAAPVDSINICFSKGLGAPVGSMLLGPADMIARAHRFRKVLGGAMRQIGVLAAAAAHAVASHLPLLADDHRRAQRFAEALEHAGDWRIDRSLVETNMVLLDFSDAHMTPAEAQRRLADRGVLIGMGRGTSLRAVFHLDITDADLDTAIDIFTTIS